MGYALYKFLGIFITIHDLSSQSKKQPPSSSVSDGKIEEIIELLVNVGNLGINDIISHSELLTYSVEKR